MAIDEGKTSNHGKRVILDGAGMERSIRRMSHEIIERSGNLGDVVLLAIPEGGVPLGKRIQACIRGVTEVEVPLGTLDITLYRDDIATAGTSPNIRSSNMLFDITDKRVILVDDVLFTGRTTRAALDAIVAYGRPKSVQLAALIDRGHRELPIKVDFVGKNVPTARQDRVHVEFSRDGDGECVVIQEGEGEPCAS